MPSSISNHIEKSFAKDFLSLKAIFEFVGRFSAANQLDDAQAFSLKFAIEEVFTNMVKYNPGNTDVTISLLRDGNKLQVQLADEEEKPFDISEHHETNAQLPIEQRKPGGLGIFLLKKLMDRVEYTHDGTHGNITLTKFLDGHHV